MAGKIDPFLMKQMMKKQGAVSQPEPSQPSQPEPKREEPKKPSTALALHAQQVSTPTQVEGTEDKTPLSFKDRLDRLDELIAQDFGISIITVDLVREHVKHLMIQLKDEPELDSILIDRDVHNILTFIRFVKDQAIGAQEVSKAKREKKERAKKGGLSGFDLDLSALPSDLKALGGMK